MRNMTKKIMIYSMVCLMQVGFGATIIEASSLYSDGSQQIVLLDDQHRNDNQRRYEQQRRENERHDQAMRRYNHESDRDWHERQRIENERHEDALSRISRDILE